MTRKITLLLIILVMAVLSCRYTVTPTPDITTTPTAMTVMATLTPSPQPAMTEVKTCVTAMVALNLRRDADPSSDNNIVARLMKGVHVEVLSRVENWSYVRTQAGLQGWVYSKYLGACD